MLALYNLVIHISELAVILPNRMLNIKKYNPMKL